MTAASDIVRLEVNDPTVEVVTVIATDGETYTSKKFGEVTAVQATLNADSGANMAVPLSTSISGGIVTIYGTGLSDLKVCLTLYGRK
jgi:hypothetical protein